MKVDMGKLNFCELIFEKIKELKIVLPRPIMVRQVFDICRE